MPRIHCLTCLLILNVWITPAVPSNAAEEATPEAKIVSVQTIWDQAAHSAFTDLIRFHDTWFCTFREADGHVKGNGKIRVIASKDGESWESTALLAEEGIDLRDPKLSVTPDDRLMLSLGGSVYVEDKLVGRQPRAAFSADGHTWSAPQRILDEGEWLWRVTWNDGVAYGVSYKSQAKGPDWVITLVRTEDGANYEVVTDLAVHGKPNETTLRFLPDDTLVALVRREGGNRHAWIGTSEPPYKEWDWNESEFQVGGPNFIILPDGTMWAGGRRYVGEIRTMLARMTLDSLVPVLELPSGGDNSYPGFAFHEGILWMTYYASHEGQSNIYLAKIRLDE